MIDCRVAVLCCSELSAWPVLSVELSILILKACILSLVLSVPSELGLWIVLRREELSLRVGTSMIMLGLLRLREELWARLRLRWFERKLSR